MPPLRALLLLIAGLLLSAAGPAASDGPPPNRLEESYGVRAGEPLRQYGYALFDQTGARAEPAMGAIADGHVLGPGDTLTVTLRGQTASQESHTVGTDGLLIVDGLRPVQAGGRSLGEVRREVEAEVASTLLDTRAFVTLARPRRLSVLILGEVRRPGRHDLSAFATVLDALFAAGGVMPSGSLRSIQLVQPGEAAGTPVDLYELMHTGEGAADQRLADGTRIVVPPLGPTLAITGQVQRPGIFELPAKAEAMDAEELLALAGGALRPGPSAFRLSTIAHDGSERLIELESGQPARLAHGDILIVEPARADRRMAVSLLGHVHSPGPRPLSAGTGAAGLLSNRAARDDAYLPFAVLVGLDPTSGARRLVPIHAGRPGTAPALADGDSLVLFGPEEIAFLSSRAVLDLMASDEGDTSFRSPPAQPKECPGLSALAARVAADGKGAFAAGPMAAAAAALTGPDLPCPVLFAEQPDLLPLALDHAVLLRECVLRPGFYPAGPGATPAELVSAAGGATGAPLAMVGAAGGLGILDAAEPWVELTGAVKNPGRIPLRRAGTLRDLLGKGEALTDDVYGLFAIIERVDRARGARTLVPFAPAEVMEGGFDRRLADRDKVVILSRPQLRAILDSPAGPEEPTAPPALTGPEATGPKDLLPADAALLRLLEDRSVSLRGAVAEPGIYPVAVSATVPALIAAAGGLLAQADPDSVEMVAGDPETAEPVRLLRLSSPAAASLMLRPGDAVRVPRRTPSPQRGGIVLAGEVREPGHFDLLPGEKLSSVLARAGGLLPTAYPAGAIFIRDSARQAERQGLLRAAEEMERSLSMALLRPDPPDARHVELARGLVEELRTAGPVGRVTMEADPAVLAVRPHLDMVLEPGDRLYVPKRPLTVTVSGEVLSPAVLQFAPGKSGRIYLEEAGGLTRNADRGRIFVLLPDGSAKPLSEIGRHAVDAIPPGSTIIVPRDAEPYGFLTIAQSVTTILSQLALTAAAIASFD